MLKKAFHSATTEDWIDRIPAWFIRLFGFVIAVGPVLTVSGWFYFAGNLAEQGQQYSLPGEVLGEETLVLQRARKKNPARGETEYATVIGG